MASRHIVLVSIACPLDSVVDPPSFYFGAACSGNHCCINWRDERSRPCENRDAPEGVPPYSSSKAALNFTSLASVGTAHQCVRWQARIEGLARTFNTGDGQGNGIE